MQEGHPSGGGNRRCTRGVECGRRAVSGCRVSSGSCGSFFHTGSCEVSGSPLHVSHGVEGPYHAAGSVSAGSPAHKLLRRVAEQAIFTDIIMAPHPTGQQPSAAMPCVRNGNAWWMAGPLPSAEFISASWQNCGCCVSLYLCRGDGQSAGGPWRRIWLLRSSLAVPARRSNYWP